MKGKTNDETKQEGRAIVCSDLDLDFFFPGKQSTGEECTSEQVQDVSAEG